MASQVRPGLTQPDTPRGLQQSAFLIRRRPAYSIRARDLASHSQAGCMGAVSSSDTKIDKETLGTMGASMYGGTTTNMSAKDMDSSESVVQKTLEAFDQGRHVAYPTRMSVRLGTLLPRFLPRSLVTKIAGIATHNTSLHSKESKVPRTTP